MNHSQMKVLAQGPKLTLEQLDAQMKDFRSDGVGILECIVFAMANQECSLREASNIVINSSTWVDRREAFLIEQEEALQEFISDNIDRIDHIQQTITTDGTQTTVHLKQPN
ncbi:MAG: hypothetical protein ACK5N9_15080 [Pirellula sp.]